MSVSLALTITAIASGAIYIWATYGGTQRQRYLFKPLTTVLVLLVALTLPDPISAAYRMLITIGLVFSIAGDIFLMLPGDAFVWGLVSFLGAHVFYASAFVSRAGIQMRWSLLLPFVVYGIVFVALLWPHVGGLRIPVLIYAGLLLVMGWQATELRWVMQDLAAALAMFGALFFIASDSILAFDKFRGRVAHRDLWIMSTYYTAVMFLAWSIHQFGRT